MLARQESIDSQLLDLLKQAQSLQISQVFTNEEFAKISESLEKIKSVHENKELKKALLLMKETIFFVDEIAKEKHYLKLHHWILDACDVYRSISNEHIRIIDEQNAEDEKIYNEKKKVYDQEIEVYREQMQAYKEEIKAAKEKYGKSVKLTTIPKPSAPIHPGFFMGQLTGVISMMHDAWVFEIKSKHIDASREISLKVHERFAIPFKLAKNCLDQFMLSRNDADLLLGIKNSKEAILIYCELPANKMNFAILDCLLDCYDRFFSMIRGLKDKSQLGLTNDDLDKMQAQLESLKTMPDTSFWESYKRNAVIASKHVNSIYSMIAGRPNELAIEKTKPNNAVAVVKSDNADIKEDSIKAAKRQIGSTVSTTGMFNKSVVPPTETKHTYQLRSRMKS